MRSRKKESTIDFHHLCLPLCPLPRRFGCKILPLQMEKNYVLIIHLGWNNAGAELVQLFQLSQLWDPDHPAQSAQSALRPRSVSSWTQLSQLLDLANPNPKPIPGRCVHKFPPFGMVEFCSHRCYRVRLCDLTLNIKISPIEATKLSNGDLM
jgi:hypothetical protein